MVHHKFNNLLIVLTTRWWNSLEDYSAHIGRAMHIGQHVEIHGPYVTDKTNGWNEIDPANFIKDLGV